MVWLKRLWSFLLGFFGAIALGAVVGTFAVNREFDSFSANRQPAQVYELRERERDVSKNGHFCDRFKSEAARLACRSADPAKNSR